MANSQRFAEDAARTGFAGPLDAWRGSKHASAAASMRGLGTTDTVVPWRACLDLAASWGWRE